MIEGMRPLQARLRAVGDTRGQARQLGLLAVAEAKHRVAHKTGTTRRTIRLARVTEDTATVTVGGAGAYLEFDTRPHDIRPRNKKALFFPSQKVTRERFGGGAKLNFTPGGRLTSGSVRKFGNAAFVLTKLVHHPGTKAQPFLIPGARAAISKLGIGAIVDRWNKAA